MFDYAVHADLLVYWTGSDIDKRYDPGWRRRKSSYTDHERVLEEENELRRGNARPCPKHKVPSREELESLEREYIERLRSILKYGLWMNIPRDTGDQPDSDVTLYLNKDKQVSLPKNVARVCFTELRLSQVRTHARRYGRLGIGFKRPFLLDRGGRPVIYCGPRVHRERDALLCACDKLFKDDDRDARDLLAFLKPMHEKDEEALAQFYAESEWRIVYTDLLDSKGAMTDRKAGYPENPEVKRCSVCVRATAPQPGFIDSLTEEAKEAAKRLGYLLPLDGWLSCIIYPSVRLKSQALADGEIRRQICRIKEVCAAKPQCRANDVEKGNWPVEMDIDLCRNL